MSLNMEKNILICLENALFATEIKINNYILIKISSWGCPKRGPRNEEIFFQKIFILVLVVIMCKDPNKYHELHFFRGLVHINCWVWVWV